MPPSRSGIADYSEALAAQLGKRVELTIFSHRDQPFDPGLFDVALYQIGNNGYHDFVYETALRHPGVAVLHEANLHHLIADLTIRRENWDAYVAECHYEGGEPAKAYALRVRALEVGPDYEGLAMTRRLLEASRGVIVHSRFMVDQVQGAGYHGPLACIPHGAWIEPQPLEKSRNAMRDRLGLDARTPLIGTFGFLKPYKRITESLRALRRVAKVEPAVRMILGGEPHPDFPLQDLIRALGLQQHVRVLGFTPIDDFSAYIGACDVVLNLRFPTVGESSGSLLRALGLGKAVLVSDVGAFRELPDEICLKVPVGEGEEELLFEYMSLLISRPELAHGMGQRAKRWVETECSWEHVGSEYARFLEAVQTGQPWIAHGAADAPVPTTAGPDVRVAPEITEEYVRSWSTTEEARGYHDTHKTRLQRTLEITPPGGPEQSVLEMGAYLQITPSLKTRLGYGAVRGCYYGPAGRVQHREVTNSEGERFECDVDLFDAEKDRYPYADESFDTVLCCELIEHLFHDPMFLMSEVNRILKPGGHLVLTTPNIASLRGISAILQGYHPGFFHAYIKPSPEGVVDARHNREYTPREIQHLFVAAGFEVTLLETGPFKDDAGVRDLWIEHLLEHYNLPVELRGDGIYAVGRKTEAPRERWPNWLYS